MEQKWKKNTTLFCCRIYLTLLKFFAQNSNCTLREERLREKGEPLPLSWPTKDERRIRSI
jgi:hypothetical protein